MAGYTSRVVTSSRHEWIVPAPEPYCARLCRDPRTCPCALADDEPAPRPVETLPDIATWKDTTPWIANPPAPTAPSL